MKKLLTEPLLHFLLLGVGLFVLFEFAAGDEASYDENVIVVDRSTLLTFVQFRAREFDKVYQLWLHSLILSQNDPFSYVTKCCHHPQN